MNEIDIAMLIMRLWLGIVMVAHGINHARSQEGTAKWFAKVGFRSPRMNARMSAVSELAIGAGLIVGLLTSIAAAGLVATMFLAFWAVHRFAGFFVFYRPDEGYEYVVTLAVAALAIAMLGPGSVSIDAAMGIDGNLDGLTGAVIIGLGVLAGVGQAALLWRKPDEQEDSTE